MVRNESIKIEFVTDISANYIYLLKKINQGDRIEQSVGIEDLFFLFMFSLKLRNKVAKKYNFDMRQFRKCKFFDQLTCRSLSADTVS